MSYGVVKNEYITCFNILRRIQNMCFDDCPGTFPSTDTVTTVIMNNNVSVPEIYVMKFAGELRNIDHDEKVLVIFGISQGDVLSWELAGLMERQNGTHRVGSMDYSVDSLVKFFSAQIDTKFVVDKSKFQQTRRNVCPVSHCREGVKVAAFSSRFKLRHLRCTTGLRS